MALRKLSFNSSFINLESIEFNDKPYVSWSAKQPFSRELSNIILAFLESQNNWKLTNRGYIWQLTPDYLEQSKELSFLVSTEFHKTLVKIAESIYQKKFKANVDIMVNKLVGGDGLMIHNDINPENDRHKSRIKSHRINFVFGRDWQEENGGVFATFRMPLSSSLNEKPSPPSHKDVAQVYLPHHNSCFGFEISPISYHAITPIQNYTRYSLVYSFNQYE